MLVGLPFTAFLVGSNVLWALLVGSAVAKLVHRGRRRDFVASHARLPNFSVSI
jgi:hypothetical protein